MIGCPNDTDRDGDCHICAHHPDRCPFWPTTEELEAFELTQIEQEFCHCGKPLHFTDPMVEAYTKDLVRALGPTVKVNVGSHTWEVQRYYLALHGLKAAELPDLGFPEVDVPVEEGGGLNGLTLGEGETLEVPPGPLEGDESDEALLLYQEAQEALRPARVASPDTPKSPMRSQMPKAEGELSIKLQAAREAKGTPAEPAAYLDLIESIAEYLLESRYF